MLATCEVNYAELDNPEDFSRSIIYLPNVFASGKVILVENGDLDNIFIRETGKIKGLDSYPIRPDHPKAGIDCEEVLYHNYYSGEK